MLNKISISFKDITEFILDFVMKSSVTNRTISTVATPGGVEGRLWFTNVFWGVKESSW